MIYLPPILELSMFGVLEAGVPNRERVCLRPTDSVNLAQFGLLAAIQNPAGPVTPLPNLFFWFGDLMVSAPAWLVVFTGKGKPQTTVEHGTTVHIFYWGLDNTIFAFPNIVIVPVAFRMTNILTGQSVPPLNLKQIAEESKSAG